MERDTAIELLTPYLPTFIDIAQRSYRDFTETVPLDQRVTLKALTRACYVQNRNVYHLLTTYGQNGVVRLAAEDSLDYLLIEGDPESAGVRWKKVDRYDLLSSNHQSGRQDALRETQAFLYGQVAHLILGYTENDDDPLNPTLERIVLTSENAQGLEWWHPIWIAEAAPETLKLETGFEQQQLPFKVKPRRIVREGGDGEQEKKAE